ncbi:hypothetical protein NL676_021706 [Syzygium grande]|nr:hypothetical protein NL676_021706 [Syzygium grande]
MNLSILSLHLAPSHLSAELSPLALYGSIIVVALPLALHCSHELASLPTLCLFLVAPTTSSLEGASPPSLPPASDHDSYPSISSSFSFLVSFSGILERDRDRERAQARGGKKGSTKDDGLTPEQRRERDAKALQEKAAKKAAQGSSSGDAGGKSSNKK